MESFRELGAKAIWYHGTPLRQSSFIRVQVGRFVGEESHLCYDGALTFSYPLNFDWTSTTSVRPHDQHRPPIEEQHARRIFHDELSAGMD